MSIDFIIIPQLKDLGGFTVRRILPHANRPMVGPFIFLDHFGPVEFAPGKGIDVRPHPHIGLATVTYLFTGEILHQDNIGSHQVIIPGDVNWMTAGSGIVHSERTANNERQHVHYAHGLQSWIALPKEHEECPPEFFHYPAETLPEIVLSGVKLRIIAGEAYNKRSPVKTYSPLMYVEIHLEQDHSLILPSEYTERGVYLLEGEIIIEGENVVAGSMAAFHAGSQIKLHAKTSAHIILFGGEPFKEPRFIEWNFVSSSMQRIEQAKSDWKNDVFKKIPGDNKEFIPLPTCPEQGTIL
jgi:hypothetical protein